MKTAMPVESRVADAGGRMMRDGWRAAVMAVLLAGAGCSLETAGSGEACTRSAQCAAGLACVEGECSQNIDAIGAQSTVPMLVPEEPDAAADAGMTDAAVVMDAAAPMGTAGTGGAGGMAGAGGTGGDAATADAGPAQSDAAMTPPGDASTDGG